MSGGRGLLHHCGSEFTAAGLLMQRWFPQVGVWIWCFVFAAVLFTLNAISSRVFGESEFWFALVKVAAVIGLIVLGGRPYLVSTRWPKMATPSSARTSIDRRACFPMELRASSSPPLPFSTHFPVRS